MRKTCCLGWTVIVVSAATPVLAQRGGGAWTTAGGDAQRTAAVRTDPKISVASMRQPGFQFLWKRKLDAGPLTQPLLLPNIIAYKGFKALAFVASGNGGVYSVDYDLNRMFWEQKLPAPAVASSNGCSPGLPAITRVTPVASPTPGARGGGGGGRGRGAAGPQIAGGRGGNDNLFVVARDGLVHVMNPQVGTDQIPPVAFLPANANVVGSVLVDTVLYAATTGGCGGAANGVWALDLASEARTVVSFDTKGAPVVGTTAPTLGTDRTLYIATGSGDSPVGNAVVSLDARTLVRKDWFSAGASPFTSNPVVFQHKGRDLVVAANRDGRLYVLDAAAPGGADHSTPLSRSAPFAADAAGATGLATWLDAAGTRWVVATSNGPLRADMKFAVSHGAVSTGALAAFTLVDQNDVPTLQPQWVSRDLLAPATPAVVNGVVFALASGQAADGSRARRSAPAVLYALDGSNGRELWTSGNTIASVVQGIGPSAGDSQVYVVTHDGILYTFGMPAER